MRTIAIGDIHGCLAALQGLLDEIAPTAGDTIVTLGDYIDRGPDSRGVIAHLMTLAEVCHLVPILGNHDEMLLQLVDGRKELFDSWIAYGGATTLGSYDVRTPEEIPDDHLAFLRQCAAWHETAEHLFFHAGYDPDVPLERLPAEVLRWRSLRDGVPGPHPSGKRAILGHTSQRSGEILDLGYLVCIDTRCYGGQWLTAMEAETGRIWQVDPRGHRRNGQMPSLP